MLFSEVQLSNDFMNKDIKTKEINCTANCLLKLQEINKEWYNINKKMIYLESKSLKEDNFTLLNLSIKDFFNKVIEILKRLRDNLNKFWIQFKTYAKQFDHKNAVQFKKYETIILNKDLKRFKSHSRKYTINNKVPNLSIKDEFLRDFSLDKLRNLTETEVVREQNKADNFADNFRGKILNKHYSILKEDFITELELVYRGNDKNYAKIELRDGSAKMEFLNYLRSFEKDIDELDKQKTEINSFYNTLINYFKSFAKLVEKDGEDIVRLKSTRGPSLDIYTDKYDLITTYGECKSRMCKSALSIYNMAFSMKLDAYKERNNRFKEILIDVLNFNNDGDQYTLDIYDQDNDYRGF